MTGPQPPPNVSCATDVSAKLAPLCVGKHSCDLSNKSTIAELGPPCSHKPPFGPQQLAVRVSCGPASSPPASASGSASAPSSSAAAGQRVTVNITVPSGSTGEVHVPLLTTAAAPTGTIKESGVTVWQDGRGSTAAPAGVKFVRDDGRFAVFSTAAGAYTFEASVN